jgi:hypothetical protein
VNGKVARKVLGELIRRRGDIASLLPPATPPPAPNLKFLDSLFQQQKDLIFHPSKRKAALCTRRAGKTHACISYILKEVLENPGVVILYIALSRGHARRLIWGEMKKMKAKFALPVEFGEASLSVTAGNGSVLHLVGANDSSEIEKFRGGKFKLVVCDEAASFGKFFSTMIREVISPGLGDLRGTLVLIGTPAPHCHGLFYDVTITGTTKDWYVASWTLFDNPHFPNPEEFVASEMAAYGWTTTSPGYLREYCGQWTKDEASLIYKYSDKNLLTAPPSNLAGMTYAMGVDIGYHDADAVVILAYRDDSPNIWVAHAEAISNQNVSDLGERVRALYKYYRPAHVTIDTGGGGKKVAEELRARYQVPYRAADKAGKNTYISLFNGELARGHIQIDKECPLRDEWDNLIWKITANKKAEEDERFANHLSDAALYAWRAIRKVAAEDVPEAPPEEPGQKQERLWREALDRDEERMKRDWEENNNFWG